MEIVCTGISLAKQFYKTTNPGNNLQTKHAFDAVKNQSLYLFHEHLAFILKNFPNLLPSELF